MRGKEVGKGVWMETKALGDKDGLSIAEFKTISKNLKQSKVDARRFDS